MIATPASLRGDGKTALVFGPYADLPPGKYRAEFILKTDRTDRTDRVATVDVFTHKDGYPPVPRERFWARISQPPTGTSPSPSSSSPTSRWRIWSSGCSMGAWAHWGWTPCG